jgi:hypothetical protein
LSGRRPSFPKFARRRQTLEQIQPGCTPTRPANFLQALLVEPYPRKKNLASPVTLEIPLTGTDRFDRHF